jgi:dihydroxyacetone kinase
MLLMLSHFKPGESEDERIVVLVNNLGGTTNMEMLILCRDVLDQLFQRGLRVERIYCGTFLSALEVWKEKQTKERNARL